MKKDRAIKKDARILEETHQLFDDIRNMKKRFLAKIEPLNSAIQSNTDELEKMVDTAEKGFAELKKKTAAEADVAILEFLSEPPDEIADSR